VGRSVPASHSNEAARTQKGRSIGRPFSLR
jgi:hypothetical protein